jgi:replicative DNA helicase
VGVLIALTEPSNYQAEREILASALIDTDRAKELTHQLTVSDFYSSRHKRVFSAISILVDKGEEATAAGVLEVLKDKLMPSDLVEITNSFMPSNDRANVKILKDNSYLRQIMKATRLLYERAASKDYQDIETFALEVESTLNIKPGGIVDIDTLLQSSAERLEGFFDESMVRKAGPLGYRLGEEFRATETRLDGIQQGLYLLGGTPNTGKTSFLVSISRALIENNPDLHIAFFSEDDHSRKIYFRLLAGISRLPINYVASIGTKLLNSDTLTEKQKTEYFRVIEKAKKRLDAILTRLHIFDSNNGGEIGFIDETVRALKRKFGNLAVIVDGLSKVQIKGFKGEATARVGELSARLKRIANENNCPLLTTAELRKLNHQGAPVMDDLRDSSQLGYDADIIMLLHNPWSAAGTDSDMYRITTAEVNRKRVEFTSPILELNFSKNKLSGFRGTVDLVLVPDLAIVKELEYWDALAQAEKAFRGGDKHGKTCRD